MRDSLADHLLRHAIEIERAVDVADAMTADAYDSLTRALGDGRRLTSVTDDAGPLGEPSMSWRSRDLGRVLDALIDVGAISLQEAGSFLARRVERVRVVQREAHGVFRGATPPPLDELLDELLAAAPRRNRTKLTEGPLALDLISPQSGQFEDVPIAAVGAVRRRLPGPPERHCGLRVLATELCDAGVLLHVQLAINPIDVNGEHPPLADEIAADSVGWPFAPELRLADSAGTTYRGVIGTGDLGDAEDVDDCLTLMQIAAFAPAVPSGASDLWLVSDDAQLRIRLR